MEKPNYARAVPRTQGFYPVVASASPTPNFNSQPFASKIVTTPVVKPLPTTSAITPRSAIQCYLACAVLFIFFSRFFDVYVAQYRIPAITLAAAALAALFSGHLLQALQYRVSKLLILFTAVLLVSSAFSVWRGGSYNLVLNVWLKSLLVYVLISTLIQNWQHCTQLARTMAWSIGVLSVLTYIYANGESGRFFLSQGKLSNPNDLAQALLIGVPFLLMMFSQSATLAPTRIVSLLFMGILAIDLLHTGSRGGMISAAISLVILMATSTSRLKVGTALILVAILAAGTLAFSPALRARYMTFFDPNVDDDMSQQTARISEIAVSSAVSRREVLVESVRQTLLHPILGVGPGMFAEARERDAAKQGKHVSDILTHNTFTQVSSECGIPAMVVFAAILVSIFRTTTKIHRMSSKRPEPSMKAIAAVALALRYSVLAYGTTCLFLSVAYQSLLPSLAGMVVALEYSAGRQLAALARSPIPVQPPINAAGSTSVPAMPVVGYGTRLRSKFNAERVAPSTGRL